jgi:putative membrane protein
MVTAFVLSSLFLTGYVIYHYVHGDTKYTSEGMMRGIYFAILASHVLLSMAVVPLSLTTFYFAWRKRFRRHRIVARVTLPIWLYVSVTGVVIYFMLH